MDTTNKLAEDQERARFEAEAIARTWAYRSEHGLRFYPSHEGGGDLWNGWRAAKQDAAKSDAAQATQAVSEPVAMQPAEAVASVPSMSKWEHTTDPLQIRRLGKTGEELAELAAVISRCLIQGIDAIDPSSGKTNRQRLIDETADVRAQLNCNDRAFDLPVDQMAARIAKKESWMAEWEAHYTHPAPASASVAGAGEAQENAALRLMLACRVAGAGLYADDGELQDNTTAPFIDFKRDSAAEIERKLIDRGIKNFAREASVVLAGRPVTDGEASLPHALQALRAEALEVFDGPETSQDVRDVIEWFASSINVEMDRARSRIGAALARQAPAPLSQAVPAGFWLAPMEPDEEMWTEGRDPIMYRDLGDYRPASMEVPAWQREPNGEVNHDKSKGTAAVRVWRAMRDSWLSRHPQPQAAALTEEQWYDLASAHATADWNGPGFLDLIKAVSRAARAAK